VEIPLSRRCREVTPFLAMEIMERAQRLAAAGRDVILLCLGEPDLPTPAPVVAAAVAALETGATSYTHSLGLPQLREEIAAHYRRRYGVTVDPGRIIVSSGTSPLLLLLFAALLEEGDEVVLADPGYACYPNFIRFAGGCPRFLPTTAEDGFQPRPAAVRQLLGRRSRGVLINSPANPAGSLLPPAWLEELASLPVPVIADEIYHGLSYAGEERSILEFTDQAFVLGGFSKAYAMTGWRLGYLIAPASCMRPLQSMHQNFLICAGNFVQQAGVVALRDCQEEVAAMRVIYDRRRRRMVARLRELGFGIPKEPDGAFYVLADARHLCADSLALAGEILEATGVAVTPGIDFGPGAEGFLRFSYANSQERIDTALDRLADYLQTRPRPGA
jgi:(5-formylfuran-3-yl)methyl phosphate transaminase